jgi:hypothetical protein
MTVEETEAAIRAVFPYASDMEIETVMLVVHEYAATEVGLYADARTAMEANR